MSTYSVNIQDKINAISQKFYSALDDFSNSYVNYKLYPDQSEYQQIYANSQGVIDALQADMFVASNDFQNNVDKLNTLISDLNSKIEKEKSKNYVLKKQLSAVSSESNGSGLLINQSQTLYFDRYVSNTTLAVGILIVFATTFTVFSQRQQLPKSL
jgi:hypothetical protein